MPTHVTAMRSLRELFGREMEPREFCRRWFEADEQMEAERGYRAKCVRLLSQVLSLEINTIERWGAGINFERMPAQYKVTLSYVDTLRQIISAASSQGNLLQLVMERLKESR